MPSPAHIALHPPVSTQLLPASNVQYTQSHICSEWLVMCDACSPNTTVGWCALQSVTLCLSQYRHCTVAGCVTLHHLMISCEAGLHAVGDTCFVHDLLISQFHLHHNFFLFLLSEVNLIWFQVGFISHWLTAVLIFSSFWYIWFLSASLYVSKRGAYWDRLCRDVVGWLVIGCHTRALWPNGAS